MPPIESLTCIPKYIWINILCSQKKKKYKSKTLKKKKSRISMSYFTTKAWRIVATRIRDCNEHRKVSLGNRITYKSLQCLISGNWRQKQKSQTWFRNRIQYLTKIIRSLVKNLNASEASYKPKQCSNIRKNRPKEIRWMLLVFWI